MDEPIFPSEDTHISRRFLAHWIDGVVVTLIFVVLLALFLALESAGGLLAAVLATLFAFVALGGHLRWFVRQESRDGFTVGKRAFGIRVVTAELGVPTRVSCGGAAFPWWSTTPTSSRSSGS